MVELALRGFVYSRSAPSFATLPSSLRFAGHVGGRAQDPENFNHKSHTTLKMDPAAWFCAFGGKKIPPSRLLGSFFLELSELFIQTGSATLEMAALQAFFGDLGPASPVSCPKSLKLVFPAKSGIPTKGGSVPCEAQRRMGVEQ
jgi:hypothetical protein